jgi:hypothetical protein
MPANVRRNVRSRVQSMTSPQSVRGRVISTQHPAWCPAQCPMNHPGNCRATAETCPGSWRETSHQAPVNVRAKFAPKLARWFADDLAIAVAIHAASGMASGAVSAESSAQHPMSHPGNCRAVSEQLARYVSNNADECPHHVWRNGSQVT